MNPASPPLTAYYPPNMQGLGYVLSRDIVQMLGAMAPSLKVYTNEDMMVG